MAIGPVQLLVFAFDKPEFKGEVVEELKKLRESDTVRVIDAIALYKDAEGAVQVKKFQNLSPDEEIEFGAKVGALLGLGLAGEEGLVAGAEAGAEAAADGIDLFDAENAWDVVGELPNDTGAAILLIEHHWAVGFRDAVARANGFRVGDAFISPLDLVAIGLLTQQEAEKLEETEPKPVAA